MENEDAVKIELPTASDIPVTNSSSDDANINKNKTLVMNNIHWAHDHEKILIEWADKAMCYRWLHSKANSMYSNLNALYTIPVIIISTLTGTANFAVQRVPPAYQGLFLMAAGGFNILAGVITTIQQFLKVTQLNEAHRVSSISWDKFYRNIKIELAKHPSERINVVQMIKMSKEEFDRLMETSPLVPESIITKFKNFFQKSEHYDEIIKPEICDVLVSTNNYINNWYENEKTQLTQISMSNSSLSEKKSDVDRKMIMEIKMNLLNNFKKHFYEIHNREPLTSEIVDNLKDKIEITLLKSLLETEIDNV